MPSSKILFVTTNKGKVESMRRRLPTTIELEIASLSLPELQAESAVEVVTKKAIEAFALLHKPLVIQDSSFHIKALNGFPGAYIKYMIEKLGLQGILAVMKTHTDRSCYFEDAIGYTENGRDVTVFYSHNKGHLSETIEKVLNTHSWGPLWQIFIPDGSTKAISALTEEEFDIVKKTSEGSPSCFEQFVSWITDHSK